MDLHAAKDYILKRLKTELSPDLYFHSFEHTVDVYNAAKRLISLEKITGENALVIKTASLYHDAGMIIQYGHHEKYSIQIAQEFLPQFGYPDDIISKITGAIQATRLPQHATNLCEQVVCDADLDSLGREDFFISSFKLRAEWEKFRIQTVNLRDWLIFEMEFLENHNYYTESAIILRQEGKIKHLEEIKNAIAL